MRPPPKTLNILKIAAFASFIITATPCIVDALFYWCSRYGTSAIPTSVGIQNEKRR